MIAKKDRNLSVGMAHSHFWSVVTPPIRGMQRTLIVVSLTISYGRGDVRVCPGRKPKGVHSRLIAVLLTPRSPARVLVVLLTNKTREFTMSKKTLPKQAVIYCRTAITSVTGNNISLMDRQDKCIDYASQKGIKVLNIFTDEGTNEPPHLRLGFSEMQEFLSKTKQPVAVIIPDVAALTRKTTEIPPVFKLLKETMGVELVDIAYISGSVMQRRMEYEALLEETLREFHDLLDALEAKSARFFETMIELEKKKEALYESE